MKVQLLVMLMVCSIHVIAQNKNNLYADLTINGLGGSATYGRKISKHIDIGLGTCLYDFNSYTYHNIRFATFGDFRRFWVKKRNLFFMFADPGIVFYAGRIPSPEKATLGPNSPYLRLGLGYGYKINKRGMGPYIAVTTDWFLYHEIVHNPLLQPQARDYTVVDAELLISLGFKF